MYKNTVAGKVYNRRYFKILHFFKKMILKSIFCPLERRTKKMTKLFFTCALHSQHCLYTRTFFVVVTRYPRIWIHLMFIALQSQSKHTLSARDNNVTSLKHCWDMLKDEKQEFLTIVTGSFPCHKVSFLTSKKQDLIFKKLKSFVVFRT